MKYAKVNGHVNLIRDQSSKAILNIDMNEYNNYVALRNHKKNENEKIESIENEMSEIKNDLNEIKDLLRSFINESR